MPQSGGEQTGRTMLRAGQAALGRAAWTEARSCFAEALRAEETPEALEGLGMAAWGLNDAAATFEARERAYRLYRQGGDRRGAARVAASLAIDHFYFRGETAIARGWLDRGRRLLAGAEPCAEAGWLTVVEAQITGWADHDFGAVGRLAAEAASLGRAVGDLDLEMMALACEGLALVSQGQVAEGMRRLDEATLAAVAGEMRNIDAACTSCCCLIFACEWTRDYERAAQWIARMGDLAQRWGHPTLVFFCRTHYAGLLISQGDWAGAEAELVATIAELEAAQPALAAEALVRLADLRCRQGRLEAAAALLARAEAPPFRALAGDICLLVRAGMALAQSDLEAAVELAERYQRTIPADNRMERFGGLELLVPALVARGEQARAEGVLADLRAVTEQVGTRPMRAAASFNEGLVAAGAADFARARRCFEDAADDWARSGAPYEAAQARLGLAEVLLALDRPQDAGRQARAALDTLGRLGAEPDAARAAELLAACAGPPRRAAPPVPAGLTPRECEVLCLIAAGRSNQEIARALVLSVRTVERHISNIYAKLELSGPSARVAAAAFALRHGLEPGSARA